MNLTPLQKKVLDAYMRNELSMKDRERLEAMISDAPGGQLYRSYLASKGFEGNFLKNKKANTIQVAFNNNLKPKLPKAISGFIAITAASLLVLLSLSVHTYFTKANSDYFANYYEGFPNIISPIVRGDQPTFSDSAFFWYETKSFDKAYLAFQNRYRITNNPDYGFYEAVSAIENTDFQAALEVLVELKDSDYPLINVARDWYTALLLLKMDNTAEALPRLENLANRDNIYRIKAKQLLLELSE